MEWMSANCMLAPEQEGAHILRRMGEGLPPAQRAPFPLLSDETRVPGTCHCYNFYSAQRGYIRDLLSATNHVCIAILIRFLRCSL